MKKLENMNERELDLFDAFEAGFLSSGEGQNGEYVGERHRGKGVVSGADAGEVLQVARAVMKTSADQLKSCVALHSWPVIADRGLPGRSFHVPSAVLQP